MNKNFSNSSILSNQAKEVLPGGVNSPVRAYNSVGGNPLIIKSGKGQYLTDVDGNTFVDMVSGYGAIIHGHSNDQINDSVKQVIDSGTTFGATTEHEITLANMIVDRVDGCEMVRMVNSGTEAVMSAVRLARGVTNRNKIVKFSGCYHGHLDSLMASAGSGVATNNLADSSGVSDDQIKDTVIYEYNSLITLDETIAAVIVEPIAANMNLVIPQNGFLQHLRNECSRVGALLIFDEVITGFRVAFGGASSLFDIEPDLWCFGKIMGGGFPIGCYGGKKSIMQYISPLGPVYQAGTLSGNGASMVAGAKALELLNPDSYSELEYKANYLAKGMNDVFRNSQIPVYVQQYKTMLGMYCGVSSKEQADSITTFNDMKSSLNSDLYTKLFWNFIQNGVLFAPSPFEVSFVGMSHDDTTLKEVVEATYQALQLLDE